MKYQLLLGDTLAKLKEMESESVHLGICSPPYPGVTEMWGELFAPENFDKAHAWLDLVWTEQIRVLKPGCKLAVNIGNTLRRPILPNAARVQMFAHQHPEVDLISDTIWMQGQVAGNTAWGTYRNPSDPSMVDVHEHIIIMRKKGERQAEDKSRYYIGENDFMEYRIAFWKIAAQSAKRRGHIAPFPLELPMRLIKFFSFPNEIVLDAFSGSGTTGEACALLDRDYIGIDHSAENNELARGYIETAMTRMGHQQSVERRGDKKKVLQMGAFA